MRAEEFNPSVRFFASSTEVLLKFILKVLITILERLKFKKFCDLMKK